MESSMLSGENKELEDDVVVFTEFDRDKLFAAMKRLLTNANVFMHKGNIIVHDHHGGERWTFLFNKDGIFGGMTGEQI